MSRERCLQEIEGQYRIMRDRLRSVCTGNSNGLYLFGPPGWAPDGPGETTEVIRARAGLPPRGRPAARELAA